MTEPLSSNPRIIKRDIPANRDYLGKIGLTCSDFLAGSDIAGVSKITHALEFERQWQTKESQDCFKRVFGLSILQRI